MHKHHLQEIKTQEQHMAFEKSVLDDIEALKFMLREDWFENDIQRIGSEQEMDIVNELCRPALVGNDIVNELDRSDVVEEYARFNLEINSDPIELYGGCFDQLHRQLKDKLHVIQTKAKEHKSAVLLTGILPTLRNSDLSLGALSPSLRYKTMLKLINQRRGGNYEFHIEGIDQLISRENPTVYGGSFTSFQIHLQIPSPDFAEAYNWAQLISGPVMAACTNSPIFLGKRLWHETRIALFGQTTDTRKPYKNLINERPRAAFGDDYVTKGIVDLFKRDITNYKAFVMTNSDANSLETVKNGEVPSLESLKFHNGTVYRWNRPCLGTEGKKPHLRIENRYIPSGPTLVDEIANAAFWIGLMEGRPKDVKDFSKLLAFDHVRANFSKAAQWGLESQFRWFEGELMPAQDLILDHLLPMAKDGLEKKGVSKDSIDKYLNIIEYRVAKAKTGSIWMLDSFRNLRKNASVSDASLTITSFCKENCLLETPVHEWPILTKKYAYFSPIKSKTAEDIMNSDIFTIRKHDLLDFGDQVMQWKNLTHVPVEDEKGKLCGILAKSDISEKSNRECAVEEVMLKDFISVCPETSFLEVKKLMKKNGIHCLPVMVKGTLAGLILEEDVKKVSEFESS